MSKIKNILEGIGIGLLIIFDELVIQILAPLVVIILWLISMPIKIVALIFKLDILTGDYDKFVESLEDFKNNWILHYSLMYLMALAKYKIVNKVGWCL